MIAHPLNNLIHGIKGIQKLHEAHALFVESADVLKTWCKDQQSIYMKSGIALLCACSNQKVRPLKGETARPLFFLLLSIVHEKK